MIKGMIATSCCLSPTGWPVPAHSVAICEGLEDWGATDLSNLSDSEEEDQPSPLVRWFYCQLLRGSAGEQLCCSFRANSWSVAKIPASSNLTHTWCSRHLKVTSTMAAGGVEQKLNQSTPVMRAISRCRPLQQRIFTISSCTTTFFHFEIPSSSLVPSSLSGLIWNYHDSYQIL